MLSKRGNKVTVATADPSDQQAAEKVKFATQANVDWVIAEVNKLTRLIDALTASASEGTDHIVGPDFEFEDGGIDMAPAEPEDRVSSEVEDAPIVKFLHKMLLDAYTMRASDLHFEPYEHFYQVRFRIDGALREIATPPVANQKSTCPG